MPIYLHMDLQKYMVFMTFIFVQKKKRFIGALVFRFVEALTHMDICFVSHICEKSS